MEDHFSTTVAKVSKARLIPPAESFDGSSSRRLGDALSHPQISLTRQNSYVQLFNTSGELYREMKISEKLETLSEDAALDLLAANESSSNGLSFLPVKPVSSGSKRRNGRRSASVISRNLIKRKGDNPCFR